MDSLCEAYRLARAAAESVVTAHGFPMHFTHFRLGSCRLSTIWFHYPKRKLVLSPFITSL